MSAQSPCGRARASICWGAQQVYPYGRHLIEQSAVHPLVSGFYKLFAVTLQLGDDAGYFDDDDKAGADKARTLA